MFIELPWMSTLEHKLPQPEARSFGGQSRRFGSRNDSTSSRAALLRFDRPHDHLSDFARANGADDAERFHRNLDLAFQQQTQSRTSQSEASRTVAAETYVSADNSLAFVMSASLEQPLESDLVY